jgi:glycosyltransferase involved in cell wall biosynthesis
MTTFWKKPPEEEGISCVIRALNEAEWAQLSILSLLEFADEIIFVDNGSSDGTPDRVRELKDGWGIDKLKIYSFPVVDAVKVRMSDLCNFAFSRATKSWLFLWDADFIARTDQLYSIMEFRDLWGEFRNRVDYFRLAGPNLWGDHEHVTCQLPHDPEYCFNRYLFRNRKWRFEMWNERENLVLKSHRRSMHIGPPANPADRRVYFFHMKGLKPEENIAFRRCMADWWEFCEKNPGHGKSYDDWRAEFFGTNDIDAQKSMAMEQILSGDMIKPFDKIGGDWGEYPTVLRPYIKNPKYEIVSDDSGRRRITRYEGPAPLPEKI